LNISLSHYIPWVAAVWGTSEGMLMLLRRSAPGASHDRNSLRLIWLANTVGIAGAIFAVYKLQGWMLPLRVWVLLAALILFVAGVIIRVYSIVYLGKFFTTNVAITVDHKLIDTGPYKLIRHPAYTGAMMTFFGFGLFFCNAASLLFMIVPVYAAFLWRIHVEEQALLGAFGEKYKEYMKRTKRLVPWVY